MRPALTLDSANHCAIASPLLRVCQVRYCIQIGGDEVAPWVLADAERCILDLVVVDMPVKSHHHCSNLYAQSFQIAQSCTEASELHVQLGHVPRWDSMQDTWTRP